MKKDLFKMPIFSAVILRKGQQVCLLKRSAKSVSGGVYAFAGGSVDGAETILGATAREAEEELGINVKEDKLKMVHVMHVKTSDGHEYINFFFEASIWEGEPKNMEPEKCDDVAWFDLNQLPSSTMATHKHVVDMINRGIVFSDYGWH